jgi:hypothetical protein
MSRSEKNEKRVEKLNRPRSLFLNMKSFLDITTEALTFLDLAERQVFFF